MKLFICSDIHSCYDELQKSLIESNYDKNNPDHKLIILGDFFDNGTQAKEVKDFILNNDVSMIRGNHDDSLIRIYETGYIKKHDFYDGTFNTMQQLGDCFLENSEKVLAAFREKNKDLMELYSKMPYYLVIGDVLLIHSWVPPVDDIKNATKDDWHKATLTSLSRQISLVRKGILPNLYPYTNIKKIVFGHHKADDIDGLEEYNKNGVYTECIKTLKMSKLEIYGIDGRVQLTHKIPILIMEV